MNRIITFFFPLVAVFTSVAQQAPQTPETVAEPSLKLTVKGDMLALRAAGSTNIKSDTWQWRVLPTGPEDQIAWSPFDPPGEDGAFKLATPMPPGGWYRLEVRVMDGETVIKSAGVTRPEPEPLTMVTAERISALPEGERQAWTEYLRKSEEHAKRERAILTAECRELRKPASVAAPSDSAEFEFPNKVDPAFFESPETGKLADTVLSYQTPTGGWSKAVDYSKGPRPPGTHWTTQAEDGWHYSGTLDNRSTTEQIKFLARMHEATRRPDCLEGLIRGLDWLFDAQFPNGGWPQVYPLESGYHEAITLNDDAMVHVLEVLRSVSLGEAPFGFLDDSIRQRATDSYDRGIACLLACQVVVEGKRSVWCAQHDPITLAPVAARPKEPVSLSGAESAALLKFFMRLGPITDPVRKSVEDAVAWLEAHRITDIRKTETSEGKTDYVKDPSSNEVWWARFYDVQTGQPVFAGSEDGIIYATFHEMAQHNKVGYDYFTTKPRDVVSKEIERWHKRMEKEGADR